MPSENRSHSCPNARAAGFTLIEILVALAILAMVFAAGLEVFSRGLSAMSKADYRAGVAQFARQKLDEVTVTGPDEGVTDGRSQAAGFPLSWRVTVSPYEDDKLGPVDDKRMKLLAIEVVVEWEADSGPRSYELSSLAVTLANSP